MSDRDENMLSGVDQVVSITVQYPAPDGGHVIWENPAGDVWIVKDAGETLLPWVVIGAEMIGPGDLVYLIEGQGGQTWYRSRDAAFHEVAMRYAVYLGSTGERQSQ